MCRGDSIQDLGTTTVAKLMEGKLPYIHSFHMYLAPYKYLTIIFIIDFPRLNPMVSSTLTSRVSLIIYDSNECSS